MKSTRADANPAAAPAAKAATKSRAVKAVTATAKAAAVPKPVPPATAAKPANPVKSTIKSAVKGAVKGAIKSAKVSAKTAAAPAPAKPPKLKLVRDSFTMPSDEYEQIGELKRRALASAHPAKKSELLRAGIKLLAGLGDAALLRALKAVPAIKTGRPKLKKGD